MKLHKDFYEYKTIPFTYFKKVANRHDFKKQWVTVKCQEDIMKQKPINVEIRRLRKNVWQYDTTNNIIFINRNDYRLLLKWEGLTMSNIITETYADKLYEEQYEKHYQELSKTSDDVEWIENEASKLAEIDLDNFEMEG